MMSEPAVGRPVRAEAARALIEELEQKADASGGWADEARTQRRSDVLVGRDFLHQVAAQLAALVADLERAETALRETAGKFTLAEEETRIARVELDRAKGERDEWIEAAHAKVTERSESAHNQVMQARLAFSHAKAGEQHAQAERDEARAELERVTRERDVEREEVAHWIAATDNAFVEWKRAEARVEALEARLRLCDTAINWNEPRIIPTEAVPDMETAFRVAREALEARLRRAGEATP